MPKGDNTVKIKRKALTTIGFGLKESTHLSPPQVNLPKPTEDYDFNSTVQNQFLLTSIKEVNNKA